MGNLLSSSTVYANAYLTSKGRDYLFNNENNRYITSAGTVFDLLKITHFSLSDPDYNYNVLADLTSGKVPDISGKNENCIKSTILSSESNLISVDGDMSGGLGENVIIEYSTSDVAITNLNIHSLPNPLVL